MGMEHRPLGVGTSPDGARGLPGICGLLDLARLPMAMMEGPSHIVRYANPAMCHLMGQSSDEIVGKSFAGFLGGGRLVALLDHVYRTGEATSNTGPEQPEDGDFSQSYEIWPVLADGGHPAGVMLQLAAAAPLHRRTVAMNEALMVSAMRQHELTEMAEDLNTKLQAEMKERKEAHAALLRNETLANAGRMAASIAHEINNPLEAVVNTLYLARIAPGLPEPVGQYLEVADGELMRIAHIARQTLGFYRELTAVASSTSASALMASVVNLLQAKIRSSDAKVVQQCDGEVQVMAVAGELRQVLANLLANSLDAVEQGGTVKLRCSTLPQSGNGRRRVRLTVADNGKGMKADTINHIFDPFFTTKGTVGTGLGLWVCKQLVEKNGGSIRVHSSTDGEHRGTTFSIVLAADAA